MSHIGCERLSPLMASCDAHVVVAARGRAWLTLALPTGQEIGDERSGTILLVSLLRFLNRTES